MHIYELGISSLYIPNHPVPNLNGNVNTTSSQSMTTDAEEMAVAVREQRMQQEQQYQQQQQHQQKRARGVPLSPSPSSVLMQEECRMMSPATNGGSAIITTTTTTSSSSSGAGYVHGMDFDSPAAKRQRHVAPDDRNGGHHPTFGCSSVSVSPDRFVAPQQQQPSAVIDTVSMERDDQYADAPVEWWKARPAAPPLSSTMTTSSSTTTSHSRVVGCYACQRLFVPNTATTAAAAVPTNTLHNYFTAINKTATATTKSNSAPQPSSHNNNNHQCTFCERTTCQTCLRTCEQCHYAFCILCSTQDWAGSHQQQQTMCLDCCSRNKTSAAVAGTCDEGADDAMMEA